MNAVRKLELTDMENLARANKKADKSETIYLVGKNNGEDKKVTLEYLNEKLTYFYNNGGPIMDI